MAGRIVGNKYLVEEVIGYGSFSLVWKGKHIQDEYVVAVKEISTSRLNQKLCESLLSEINILQKISHPNIVSFHGIVKEQDKIFLILEYCEDGDLAQYIERHKRVSSEVARYLMRQLASGLKVLRSNNLIHRDLKPQNLLLSNVEGKLTLKIADFGFARHLQPQGLAETICGSPLYMAPEVMQSQKYDAKVKTDLWSVGSILYQLVTGKHPFCAHDRNELLHTIIKSREIKFPNDIIREIHPDCIDLCRKLLQKNPVERLSFEEFFTHRFIEEGRFSNLHENTIWPQPVALSSLQMDSPSSWLHTVMDNKFIPEKMITLLKSESCCELLECGTQFTHAQERSFEEMLENALNKMAELDMRGQLDKEECSVGRPKVIDTSDSIEDDYVIINLHGSPTESGNESLCISENSSIIHLKELVAEGRGRNHCSMSQSLFSEAQVTANVLVSNERPSSPSDHPLTRLYLLKNCAECIVELWKEKLESKNPLEPFALQVMCLAIWRHALRVGYGWASSLVGRTCSSNIIDREIVSELIQLHFQMTDVPSEIHTAASACVQVEKHYVEAVEVAEKFASELEHVHGDEVMPDALEIIFSSALEFGREGAMKELLEDLDMAMKFYSKAVILMSFIMVEAPNLDLKPLFILSDAQHKYLSHCVDQLSCRLQDVISRMSGNR